MDALYEHRGTGGAIVFEEGNDYSREEIMVALGEDMLANTIVAVNGAGEYVAHDPAGAAPANVAVGMLYADTNATTVAQKAVVLIRHAIFNSSEVIWKDGITAAEIATATAELNVAGILIRDAVTVRGWT